jgi:hypothetical protein
MTNGQLWSRTSDSMPSEARKRGPGGGFPRKYADLSYRSEGQLWSRTSDSAPSEARKRGSGGKSPRKYDDLSYTGPKDSYGAVPVTARRGGRRRRFQS